MGGGPPEKLGQGAGDLIARLGRSGQAGGQLQHPAPLARLCADMRLLRASSQVSGVNVRGGQRQPVPVTDAFNDVLARQSAGSGDDDVQGAQWAGGDVLRPQGLDDLLIARIPTVG